VRARSLWCAVALILGSALPRAQQADGLLRRVGDWVQTFVEQFANVVAEEEYVPAIRSLGTPQLQSDYLLVRQPGSARNWRTFRDVVAVNGSRLREQPERLTKLFLQPFESAVAQAHAIATHSARYISPLADPLVGIVVMQRHYQPRFRHVVDQLDRELGSGVRRIKFEETARPTIFRDGRSDLPTHGTVWVGEATGRIVRTEVHIGIVGRLSRTTVLTTSFRKDDALDIDVPAMMVEGQTAGDNGSRKGTAYYTRFRRFSVRTTEQISVPQP
jgi:hypothetical protein